MKTIVKNYKSLAAAERFQNKLYEKYNSVKLVTAPLSSEDGKYVWHVK